MVLQQCFLHSDQVLGCLATGATSTVCQQVKFVSSLTGESLRTGLAFITMFSTHLASMINEVGSGPLIVTVPVGMKTLKHLLSFLATGEIKMIKGEDLRDVATAAASLDIDVGNWEVFQKEEKDGNNNSNQTRLENDTRVTVEGDLEDSQCSMCQSWYMSRDNAEDCQCSKMAKCHVRLRKGKSAKHLIKSKTLGSKLVSMKDIRKTKDIRNVNQRVKRPKQICGQWICYKCGDGFKSLSKCYAHLGENHKVDVVKITCNVCDYTCYIRQHFENHVKSEKHKKNKKFYKRGDMKVGEND